MLCFERSRLRYPSIKKNIYWKIQIQIRIKFAFLRINLQSASPHILCGGGGKFSFALWKKSKKGGGIKIFFYPGNSVYLWALANCVWKEYFALLKVSQHMIRPSSELKFAEIKDTEAVSKESPHIILCLTIFSVIQKWGHLLNLLTV